jgi:hypothetical protein
VVAKEVVVGKSAVLCCGFSQVLYSLSTAITTDMKKKQPGRVRVPGTAVQLRCSVFVFFFARLGMRGIPQH